MLVWHLVLSKRYLCHNIKEHLLLLIKKVSCWDSSKITWYLSLQEHNIIFNTRIYFVHIIEFMVMLLMNVRLWVTKFNILRIVVFFLVLKQIFPLIDIYFINHLGSSFPFTKWGCQVRKPCPNMTLVFISFGYLTTFHVYIKQAWDVDNMP